LNITKYLLLLLLVGYAMIPFLSMKNNGVIESKENTSEQLNIEDLEIEEDENKPKNAITFTTDDDEVEFTIMNPDGLSNEELEAFKEDILLMYNNLQFIIEGSFKKVAFIYVTVHSDEKMGKDEMKWTVQSGDFQVWNYNAEKAPLIYLLTMSLYKMEYKQSTIQIEGLAHYLEMYFGIYQNLKYHINTILSYLNDEGNLSPLEVLFSQEENAQYDIKGFIDEETLLQYEIDYHFYLDAHTISFTSYLIDWYGIEKYFEFLSKRNIIAGIEDVYGQSLKKLEKDWHNRIKEDVLMPKDDLSNF
jgi:hypothetical protein